MVSGKVIFFLLREWVRGRGYMLVGLADSQREKDLNSSTETAEGSF